jgi:hypothetical protein
MKCNKVTTNTFFNMKSMTVLIAGVVTTIVTAGAATPVTAPAIAAATTGSAYSIPVLTGAATATSAVSGSAAIGTAVGSIAGASAGGTAAAAAGGAAIGSATSAGVTSIGAGIVSGPIGWTILGAEQDAATHHIGATFDCWKPVLRDESTEPSSGKLLKDILKDQRVKRIVVEESRNEFNLPELSLVNIWDEQFNINYLVLPFNSQLVAHAVRAA